MTGFGIFPENLDDERLLAFTSKVNRLGSEIETARQLFEKDTESFDQNDESSPGWPFLEFFLI